MLAEDLPSYLADEQAAELEALLQSHLPEGLEESKGFRLAIKKKKANALLRKALIDAGYGEMLQGMSIVKE